jgi:hypothetical protein
MTLLLNVLHHHLVGHIARTGRKVASGPKVPPAKLTAVEGGGKLRINLDSSG